MSFIKNFGAHQPPTSIDVEDNINQSKSQNLEKDVENAHIERQDVPATHHLVDPALEKRVVRKLDLHIVPLVLVLCEYGRY
jgi:hypothetical protein